MELPSEWLVHILPGVIVLASLFMLTNLDGAVLTKFFKGNDFLLGSAALIGLAGYLVGLLVNEITLALIKPLLNCAKILGPPPHSPAIEDWATLYQMGRTDLIKAFGDSYLHMVSQRSLMASFIIVTVVSAWGFWWRKNRRLLRVTLLILCAITTFALYLRWWTVRHDHYRFINQGFELVISAQR